MIWRNYSPQRGGFPAIMESHPSTETRSIRPSVEDASGQPPHPVLDDESVAARRHGTSPSHQGTDHQQDPTARRELKRVLIRAGVERPHCTVAGGP